MTKALTFSFSGIRDACRASHLSRTSLWILASTSAGPSVAVASAVDWPGVWTPEEEADDDDGDVLSPPLDQFHEFDEKHRDALEDETALCGDLSVTYARA